MANKTAFILIVCLAVFSSNAAAGRNPFVRSAQRAAGIPPSLKQKMTKMDDYSNTTLYIFISSSVPIETIRNYIKQSEPIKKQTVFLLRGFIDGIKTFRPTWNYTMDILCNTHDPEKLEGADCLEAFVDINPNLFEELGIDAVPVIMVRETGGTGTCGDRTSGLWYRSSGDAPLLYHLEKMARKGSVQAENLQKRLKDVYWDK